MLLLEQKIGTALIVGGGRVALRKTLKLLDSGAKVTLIAPEVLLEIENIAETKPLSIKRREFEDGDIDNQDLVVAATNIRSLNIHISELCRNMRINVNVVDDPDLSTVYFPAIFRKGKLSVGVSTFGAAPGFAKAMRDKLENLVSGSDITSLERYAAIRKVGTDKKGSKKGKLFFVGAGPGDPELVTVRGKKAIESADLILYDGLVSPELLKLRKADTKLIDVSKRKGRHKIVQERINRLMIEAAENGLKVCRLKGGDPVIFGRLDEEIAALKQRNIEFEVVPGITAASAGASVIKQSLTNRETAHKLIISTGHTAEGKIPDLSGISGTVVFYMGLTHLKEIADKLIKEGASTDSKIFVIGRASLPDSYQISANLGEIVAVVRNSGIKLKLPALIIAYLKGEKPDE